MSKGNVLLVNPSYPVSTALSPPLGLGYIGTELRKQNYKVNILDLPLGGSLDFTLGQLKPEVVCITGLSVQWPSIKACAKEAKSFGATVIVGGIHTSALPEFILRDCKDIDYAVKGEGEYVIPDILNGKSISTIPGLYYRSNGSVKDSPQEFITDLDNLGFPWYFLKPRDYNAVLVNGLSTRRGTAISVISSRGCPYSCGFCSASQAQGKSIRLRSVSNFIEELKYLKSLGVREVQILDDNFTFYEDHAYEICDTMVKEKLGLFWSLPNGIRADKVNLSLLKKMREAGCYYFGIGIETGSARLLKLMSKQLDLDSVKTTTRLADSLGFITQGFLLVGYPGETQTDLDETRSLVLSLPLDRISVNFAVPYPGSKLAASLDNVDWTTFNRLNYFPTTSLDLKGFARRLYTSFYFDPKRLLRHVSKMRSWSQFISLFRGLMFFKREVER